MSTFASMPTGREVPNDFPHVRKWSARSILSATVPTVEKVMPLPWWHKTHDQGREGSCVGHGSVMAQAITNLQQNRLLRVPPFTRRYNPRDVWINAKRLDGDPQTDPNNPDDGTYVSVAYDVLRDIGPRRVRSMRMGGNGVPYPVGEKPNDLAEGLSANRWLTTTDEMRTAIAGGTPVVIGVNWYSEFDTPEAVSGEFWIGRSALTWNRGGHCICVHGASDRRQAFRAKNSWPGYPIIWIPYGTMARLLGEYGEAVIGTDR